MTENLVRRYNVIGSRKINNYIFTFISGLAGLDFLLTGISSYLQYDILPIIYAKNILFFPQGLVMCFYGILFILFSVYLSLIIFWDLGSGFNIFDKKNGIVRIFRFGFPGKRRRIDLFFSIKDITAIKLKSTTGFNLPRMIYLCIKQHPDIALTFGNESMSLEQMETFAASLAKFLQKDLITN